MNKISKKRLELAKRNFKRFKNPNTVAALVTGSVAKGYADDNSDIDTIIHYKKPLSKKEFDKIVNEAKRSGGDLFQGSPEKGFAVYYYIDGIKCDFGFGSYREPEKLINGMQKNPEVDLMKHLQISGFIDGYVLYGHKWTNRLKNQAQQFPEILARKMVQYNLSFEPEWAVQKMGVDRNDILYLREYFINSLGKLVWILFGLNRQFHTGKLKGSEFKIKKLKIKPKDFVSRYRKVLNSNGKASVKLLYELIMETIDLIDIHMPEQSTKRIRNVIQMELRKQYVIKNKNKVRKVRTRLGA